MINNFSVLFASLRSSSLFQNSFWGLLASVTQSIFLSLFFIILARKYDTVEFANYILASSIYQIVVSFSSMGLGQWFIREYKSTGDKVFFLNKFFKIQLYLAAFFFLINVIAGFALYPQGEIRYLIILLGLNILFDNLIYSFRNLNIAEGSQNITAQILFLDGLLRFLVSCILFVYPIPIDILCVLLILVRFITINSFVKRATIGSLSISTIIQCKVSFEDLRRQIISNWFFVVIGSLAILYWRVSNIIISKFLLVEDVVNFEIAFKIYSVFVTVPAVLAAGLFPVFVSFINAGDLGRLRKYYLNVSLGVLVFSLFSYSIVYSFASDFVPIAFGDRYVASVESVHQMFYSFLLFPIILLQANVIVAMHLERNDMYFNLAALCVHLVACFLGLYFFRSLSVVTYSILLSYLVFQVLQDLLLIGKKITTWRKSIGSFAALISYVMAYQYIVGLIGPYTTFFIFGSLIIIVSAIVAPEVIRGMKSMTVENEPFVNDK